MLTKPLGSCALLAAGWSFLSLSLLDGVTSSDIQPHGHKFIVKIDPTKTDSLDDFCHYLNSINVTHSVAHDLTGISPENFYGASLYLDNPGDASTLANLNAVESVTPVTPMKVITPVSQQILKKPPTGGQSPDGFTPHIQTRITDLHSRGVYGQGIKVAFLDSGIDCGHPALGGGFGPGHKIGFGYDLVGDDFDSSNKPVPDSDPCTPCGVHGTHVAGIVGANDLGYGFQGVAPNATLGMYRIMGCDKLGSTSNDIVMSALLMAIRDGADVISASIGGFGGWSKGDALSDLINSLVEKGTALILAAGNEGEEGLFYAETPAAATNSIAIGSVESKKLIVFQMKTSSGKNIPYHSSGVFNGTDLPIYATSATANPPNDACQPLPPSTPSLSDRVVVIRRGGCNYADKVDNAVAKGASRILFYMNSTEKANLSNFISGAQIGVLTKADGESLVSELQTNPNSKATFSSQHSIELADGGGLVSNYSQYGPSYDSMNIQPNFLGVGGNILSTIPRKSGSYATMSGTSMSTPQVAGITALVKAVRGKDLKALKLKSILSTTAQQVPAAVGQDDLQTTIHAGGGLVDAFCAAYAKTVLSTDAIALHDIPNFKSQQSFTITNEGDQTYSFRTGHSPAITVNTFRSGSHRVSTTVEKVPGSPSAQVQVSPETFTLAPHASQTIQVTFTLPTGLSAELLPVYSGYISVISDAECERHTLPYYGIAGNMKNTKVLDAGPDTEDDQQQIPRLTDLRRQPLTGPVTFDGNNGIVVRYRMAFGSPYMRVDIISANDTLVNEGPSPAAQQSMPDIGANFTLSKGTFMGAKLIGMIPTSNSTYAPRTVSTDTVVLPWAGTVIPPGETQPSFTIPSGYYKILIRALRVNGNPFVDADFDHWLSPAFTVSGSSLRQPTPQPPNSPGSSRSPMAPINYQPSAGSFNNQPSVAPFNNRPSAAPLNYPQPALSTFPSRIGGLSYPRDLFRGRAF
ncbi:hypothetical protein PTTG_05451 [Puccinia triticina 1-1 BBBD Race 1]|uniref:Peptidase S8/S53 domain-containing protein n=1 Tax=Puccinia triticina (isolate 1-1 / race 1 (BBBD)) TaxID=630390 RepID=A0A180GRL6_PUCT1|nr:hypothetical protein PTTG_05451 [Puccinia triticina 1-1 BBBD Race 1]